MTSSRRHLGLVAAAVLQVTSLGCSPAAPSTPPAIVTAAPWSPPVVAPSPEPPRCRPEVRNQRGAIAETEAAFEAFFDRVLAGGDFRDVVGLGAPAHPLVVEEIRRAHACPRFYEATSQRTPELSNGYLSFDEPSLGKLDVALVVRDTPGGGRRIVVALDTIEGSFRAGLDRDELLPFLARSPAWIPSGGATCHAPKPDDEAALALFRGSRKNVLCAVRRQASRCFELDADPSGWLTLEVDPYDDSTADGCAVGTNAVIGPDLSLRIVPYRQRRFVPRQILGHVGSAPRERTSQGRPLERTWTNLPSRWREVDPAAFPLRASLGTGEMDHEDIGEDAPPAIRGNDLFCLRLDGVWRCNARHEPWPAEGRIRARSAAGVTVASIVDASASRDEDADPFERSRFVTFARGEGGRLLRVGRFPVGAEASHFSGASSEQQVRLVQRWELLHEAPLCIRVTRARARLESAYDVGLASYRHTERDVPVSYGAAPASLPRDAPRMAPPRPDDPARPIEDLRGTWRLVGDAWSRVPSCQAP